MICYRPAPAAHLASYRPCFGCAARACMRDARAAVRAGDVGGALLCLVYAIVARDHMRRVRGGASIELPLLWPERQPDRWTRRRPYLQEDE